MKIDIFFLENKIGLFSDKILVAECFVSSVKRFSDM